MRSGLNITALLQTHYDLEISGCEALELGADANAQVYRVTTANSSRTFFLKTRPYSAHLPGVEIPAFLSQLNIPHILSPVLTRDGQPVLHQDDTAFILYPFLSGGSAMEKGITLKQWTELGAVMKMVHRLVLPEELAGIMPREQFSAQYRRQAQDFMQRILSGELDKGSGAVVAKTLRCHQAEISHMINRAETLGQKLADRQDIVRVLCHADLHKWNIFISDDGDWYVIDWDSLKLAPRECDLMYIGGNIGGDRGDPNEIPGFYQGYESADFDAELIAYYRFERIVEDIAEFCKQVWNNPPATEEECEKIASWLKSNFDPGFEYETACQSDIN